MLNGLLNMSASPVSVICLGQSEGAVTLKTCAAERRGVQTHASRTRRSVDCASEPAKYEQRDEASEHEPAERALVVTGRIVSLLERSVSKPNGGKTPPRPDGCVSRYV